MVDGSAPHEVQEQLVEGPGLLPLEEMAAVRQEMDVRPGEPGKPRSEDLPQGLTRVQPRMRNEGIFFAVQDQQLGVHPIQIIKQAVPDHPRTQRGSREQYTSKPGPVRNASSSAIM